MAELTKINTPVRPVIRCLKERQSAIFPYRRAQVVRTTIQILQKETGNAWCTKKDGNDIIVTRL